ncbi:hypothetical protein EDC04DRAFT_2598440 [Pisolithus marmoratus]|nr:hypothetical protein EDC04DRAFT_2598440 [Pisolithus marmoratus]
MKWVKVVSMLSPDEIAWFSLASVDPPLVDHMLTRFSAQWWQDGDTGQVCYGEFAGKLAHIIVMDSQCESSDEVVEALEISVHDFKLEFPMGASIQVITGLNCGFQGIVIGTVDDIGHEILITLSMLQQADPDNLRDKGKSRAQEPKVPSSNGDIDEGSDLIQVSFWLMMAHCFCIQLENHSLCDVEHQVGCKVWIISGPRKGYRGTLCSVGRTYCNVAIKSGIMQLKNTAVITDTTPPMSQSTVDPSAEPGPSTLACSPWVPHSDDITPWPLNELAQADADYRCVPWLFDNNFCDYANWHVCLRVAMSYNHGSLLNHCDLKYTHDLTPANPRSAGQYFSYYMKCQVKKDLKGVELEDGTKLPLGDVCQGPNAIHVLPEIWLCSKDNGCDLLTFPQWCSKAIIPIYTIA